MNKSGDQYPASLENLRQLISALSHDLRTPLTVIKGDIEVCLLRERSPGEYQEVLRSNLEEIDRMAGLLEDLAILMRAETGELRTAFNQIDLTELIAGLFAEFQNAAREKGIQFKLESAGQIFVKADPVLSRKLFSEVLENAIQYSPREGEIRVLMEKVGQEALVLVSDQGTGILPEEQEHIFEPLFRGEKARVLVKKGYGLGLAVCKKIVFVHNGSIDLESSEGSKIGAAFKILLPVWLGQGQGS